jgi:membrane protein YqaA with SNARE-associated domain
MWQLTGRGTDQSITRLLRAVVVRLARSLGGGVDYWIGLPIDELFHWILELNRQLREEQANDGG